MRLLHTSRLEVEQFVERKTGAALESPEGNLVPEYAVPRYAILSHTWEEGEVIFQDMEGDQTAARKKRGFEKLRGSCAQAKMHGYDWIWVDTCCIDKTSSAELSEAINSMFRWYQNASVCYVYLSDAEGSQPLRLSDDMLSTAWSVAPRWYSRGWTLQELIAPSVVIFYNQKWKAIGTKETYVREISRITGIDVYALQGGDLSRMTVARRMTWLANRETTRVEDMAYCMLGIFDINMPLLYGEGPKAFTRLQEEIAKVTEDQSLFAWKEHDSVDYYREDYGDSFERHGLLAESPRLFTTSTSVARFPWYRPARPQMVVTAQGIGLQLLVCKDASYLSDEVYLAVLDCQIGSTPGVFAGIRLRRVSGERFVRVDTPHLLQFARCRPGSEVDISGFNPLEAQDELFDLRLSTSHKGWKPRWVYVSQSALPPLPPAFWLLPPKEGMSIKTAHPAHLWDGDTKTLQPLSNTISSQKIGAIRFSFDGTPLILVFGVCVDILGIHPWCKLLDRLSQIRPLDKVFEDFTFDTRPTDPAEFARRKLKPGVHYPTAYDSLESANLRVAVEKRSVSATDVYVIQFSRTHNFARR